MDAIKLVYFKYILQKVIELPGFTEFGFQDLPDVMKDDEGDKRKRIVITQSQEPTQRKQIAMKSIVNNFF